MNRHEDSLQRLFKAAQAAPAEAPAAMPAHLQTRLLAHWRAGAEPEDFWSSLALALVCRRALVCAGVLMALSIAWSCRELMAQPESDVAIANYELRASLLP